MRPWSEEEAWQARLLDEKAYRRANIATRHLRGSRRLSQSVLQASHRLKRPKAVSWGIRELSKRADDDNELQEAQEVLEWKFDTTGSSGGGNASSEAASGLRCSGLRKRIRCPRGSLQAARSL